MAAIFTRLTNAFILNNIRLFALTLLFSIPLGLIIAFGSMNKWKPFRFLDSKAADGHRHGPKTIRAALASFRPISALVKLFVWIIRGTPLMLQILIIYFGPGLLELAFGWPKGNAGRMPAAVVTFSINYACYFSEIYRGGIQSIPKGQSEAGQVLGMTRSQIFFRVTLLQLVKRIVPPMGNEIITLIKDTALANYISILELIMTAKEYTSAGLIWPLFATAFYFLAFVGILTLLFGWVEKKLNFFRT
ncbi:MAG: amino acid ABC transporter permease [Eubacteriales bacterium]|nr:amino acid ABC transporter permease [Eubacteriales bacterium]